MPNDIRHPNQCSDAELLRMLRVERTNVIRQLTDAKAALRELVSEIAALDERLHNIDISEDYLTDRLRKP